MGRRRMSKPLIPEIVSKKDAPVFDAMWNFLMIGGQKGSFDELSKLVHNLIDMTMQKTAGQRKNKKHDIDWTEELAPTLWGIIIEATAYVLDEEGKRNGIPEEAPQA